MIYNIYIYTYIIRDREFIKYDDVDYFNFVGCEKLAKVLRIYDGDTIIVVFEHDCIHYKFKCRLHGINTPEIKNKDDVEKYKAYAARNRLIQLTTNIDIELDNNDSYQKINKLLEHNTKLIFIKCHDFDKYGRILIDIECDHVDVNREMINGGYAIEYMV